nr:MAG TPA: hypothetical protein [Caudoviricetes sp.]
MLTGYRRSPYSAAKRRRQRPRRPRAHEPAGNIARATADRER